MTKKILQPKAALQWWELLFWESTGPVNAFKKQTQF